MGTKVNIMDMQVDLLTKETLKSVDWLPADSGLIEKIEKALALLPS